MTKVRAFIQQLYKVEKHGDVAKQHIANVIACGKWFCSTNPASSIHQLADTLNVGVDDMKHAIAAHVRKELSLSGTHIDPTPDPIPA